MKDFDFDRMSFYAIGWSKKGAFAYGAGFPDQAGALNWQWHIIDLVEDKLLYSSPPVLWLKGQSPAELWSSHPQWHPRLLGFGIQPSSQFKGGGQTFRFGSYHYGISHEIANPDGEDFSGEGRRNIQVRIRRNGREEKIVYSYTPVPGQGIVNDLVVKGHILSPFEKRTALVILEKMVVPGVAGAWQYRVIGAHLGLGFSPVTPGGSALAEAVLNGQYHVSRLFLSEGTDPDDRDARGYPSLLIAARLGHWRIAGLLLDAGADDRTLDAQGRTALHYAAEAGQKELVSHLIKAGFDFYLPDGKGITPRMLFKAAQGH